MSQQTLFTVNVLKFLTLNPILSFAYFFLFMQLFLKLFSGMANSVDPDQTAPSELGLHCLHYAILSDSLKYEILGHLLYTKYLDILAL